MITLKCIFPLSLLKRFHTTGKYSHCYATIIISLVNIISNEQRKREDENIGLQFTVCYAGTTRHAHNSTICSALAHIGVCLSLRHGRGLGSPMD